MPLNPTYDSEITFQSDRIKSAVEFIKIVSDLWYDYSIELVLFRNQLMDKNVSEILKLHAYAGNFVNKPISIFDSVDMAQAIKQLNLPASKLDIGKLSFEYRKEDLISSSLFSFLSKKLKGAKQQPKIEPKDVILYGFGRIGRLVARELMMKSASGNQLRLRAIVTRDKISSETLEKRAALLRSDSIHGDFPGTVSTDKNLQALIINGMTVFIISANKPENIDYTTYGINEALSYRQHWGV
jgi:glyceraldehyde 3-phosphate dehydrogenase